MTDVTDTKPYQGVPRWPALLALLLLGGIYLLVSDRFTTGPSWLLLLIVGIALLPITMAHRSGNKQLARWLALGVLSIATLVVIISAFLLVSQLAKGGKNLTGVPLLRDAALVWCANILNFSIWYWEVDAGGPAKRRMDHHTSTDFIFPQMTLDQKIDPPWYPDFFDYLFLAFNTSTAFSPTDTLVLSRSAKLLMMLQAVTSLVVTVVLAARAVNTFQ